MVGDVEGYRELVKDVRQQDESEVSILQLIQRHASAFALALAPKDVCHAERAQESQARRRPSRRGWSTGAEGNRKERNFYVKVPAHFGWQETLVG